MVEQGEMARFPYLPERSPPGQKLIPVGAVLTMVGTGSEMNGGSVITNHAQGLKIGKVFGEEMMPKFAILNPKFTFSVPRYQMVSGIFDIMSHIMEQYFSGADDNTSDYLAEGLMRSLVKSSLDAVENPENYEARSNIMWTATWALNTLIGCGKTQDWEVHMIGQAIGAVTPPHRTGRARGPCPTKCVVVGRAHVSRRTLRFLLTVSLPRRKVSVAIRIFPRQTKREHPLGCPLGAVH